MRRYNRYLILCIFLFLCMGSKIVMEILIRTGQLKIYNNSATETQSGTHTSKWVNIGSCKMPYHDEFNEVARDHYKRVPHIKCPNIGHRLLHIDEDGYLSYNEHVWKKLNVSLGSSRIKCEYSEIIRKRNMLSVFEFEYTPYVQFIENIKPNSDFLHVKCFNNIGTVIYNDYLAFTQRNPEPRKYKKDTELDLVVIGLDSMSRLNFMRQFPITHAYLIRQQAVDLIGMNKVGVNTFPNAIAMLTGMPPPPPPNDYYKHMQFLWDGFREKGAATMYAEDSPEINMFTLHGKGLIEKPTHHYAYTFWQAVESSISKFYSEPFCLGFRSKFSIHLNYIESFLKTYKEYPKFIFSLHNELTHDFFNVPKTADEELKHFFEKSFEEGLLDRAVVVVLGDHGQRISDFRTTYYGRIEDMMPYTSVILPKRIRNRFIRQLIANSQRLISTFDLYHTFLDVLSSLDGKTLTYQAQSFRNTSSIFHQIHNRSCYSAGIPDEFCICNNLFHNIVASPNTNSQAIEAAKYSTQTINENIQNFTNLCAKLELDTVVNARLMETIQPLRMLISFKVKPSGGIFEAVVGIYSHNYFVIGEILRVNRYNGQADCLPKKLQEIEFYKTSCYCMIGRETKNVIYV